MTMRLSNSSFAGTARTLVAVGTFSDCSMFLAIAAAAPCSGLVCSPGGPCSLTGAALAASCGEGFVAGSAGFGLLGVGVVAVLVGRTCPLLSVVRVAVTVA